MSNRTELRERLRLELGDTGAVAVWSDDLLDALLVESVGWYSQLWPRQTVGYLDVAAGQRAFSEPVGAIGISGVECPPGRVLMQVADGSVGAPSVPGAGVRQTWSAWAGSVYLGNAASGDEVGELKLVMRALVPWPRLDPEEQWEGPYSDERLLVLWSAVEAWEWLEGQGLKLGRTPVSTATDHYRQELESEIEARKRAASSRILDA